MSLFVSSKILEGVAHGFFGRRGGVSSGLVESLNCGYAAPDSPENVTENRCVVTSLISPNASICVANQIHSSDAEIVTQPWNWQDSPKCDGLATDNPKVLLGVLTADCAPILLADKRAGVVGAAHAGWKGATGQVIESTVQKMLSLGASRQNIKAAIGPCIQLQSYQVGADFERNLLAIDGVNSKFFKQILGIAHFNLSAYVQARLQALEIEVENLEVDTLSGEGEYFSYRRSTIRNENGYGRQISVIGLS